MGNIDQHFFNLFFHPVYVSLLLVVDYLFREITKRNSCHYNSEWYYAVKRVIRDYMNWYFPQKSKKQTIFLMWDILGKIFIKLFTWIKLNKHLSHEILKYKMYVPMLIALQNTNFASLYTVSSLYQVNVFNIDVPLLDFWSIFQIAKQFNLALYISFRIFRQHITKFLSKLRE